MEHAKKIQTQSHGWGSFQGCADSDRRGWQGCPRKIWRWELEHADPSRPMANIREANRRGCSEAYKGWRMPDTLSIWEPVKHKLGYQCEYPAWKNKLGTQLTGRPGKQAGGQDTGSMLDPSVICLLILDYIRAICDFYILPSPTLKPRQKMLQTISITFWKLSWSNRGEFKSHQRQEIG